MVMLRQTLDDLWNAYGPKLVYQIESVDDQLASVYQQEQRLTTMVTALACCYRLVSPCWALCPDRRHRAAATYGVLVLRRLHGAEDVAIVRAVGPRVCAAPCSWPSRSACPSRPGSGERYLARFRRPSQCRERLDLARGGGSRRDPGEHRARYSPARTARARDSAD